MSKTIKSRKSNKSRIKTNNSRYRLNLAKETSPKIVVLTEEECCLFFHMMGDINYLSESIRIGDITNEEVASRVLRIRDTIDETYEKLSKK